MAVVVRSPDAARPALATVSPTIFQWFTRPGSPVVLGVFRVAVFASMLVTLVQTQPWRYADVPESLIVEPAPGAWVAHLLPLEWTPVICASFAIACVAAMVGWRARTACLVATMLGVWALGPPNWFGKVDHLGHHLLYFGLLLAASRCGDAVAVDARDRHRPPASAVYGFPVRIAWLVLGLIYFSAAIPKAHYGLSWAFSENPRNTMWRTWHTADRTPLLRIDEVPVLYQSAAFGGLLIELTFIVLVLFRRTRWIAAIAGLLFHLSVGLTLGIVFHSLIVCYVVFLPSTRPGEAVEARLPGRAVVAVGGLLIGGMAVASLLVINNGWPWASYPTFRPGSAYATTYELEADGDVVDDPYDMSRRRWDFMLADAARDPRLGEALAGAIGTDIEIVATTVYADPDAKRLEAVRRIPFSQRSS